MNTDNKLKKYFGEHLEKLGTKNKNIVVLDSDLENELNTLKFAKAFPERHFSIPESDRVMLGMATGMTIRKKQPWICGQGGAILGKGIDIIRNGICAPNLNIKIIISNIGLDNIENGSCRTTTEDIAILRCLPNMKIFTPSDQYELKEMMNYMASDFGPTTLRISSRCLESINDEKYVFTPGYPKTIYEGEKISIITYGSILSQALQAAKELTRKGISTKVINLATLSPLNKEKLAEMIQNCELIISVEDHNKKGGIGCIVSETMLKYSIASKLVKIGISCPIESGRYIEILEKHGINNKKIYEKARDNWMQN